MADDFRRRMELKFELMQLAEESGFSREGMLIALDVTSGQLRGWLSGRELTEEYLKSGQVPTSNSNAPPEHIVEKMRKEVGRVRLDLANRVLRNARKREAMAPLTREEFENGWTHIPNPEEPNVVYRLNGNANALDGRLGMIRSAQLSAGLDNEPSYDIDGKIDIPVVGRSGKLGYVTVDLGDMPLSQSREVVLDVAWKQYQDWIDQFPYDPENDAQTDFIEKFLKAKQQYRDLFTAFNLSHPEISRIISEGVEPDENDHVQTKGRSLAASFAAYTYPRFPPRDIIYILQKSLQSWAADTLHAVDLCVRQNKPIPHQIAKPVVPTEELMKASTYMVALNAQMIKELKARTAKKKVDPAKYTELPEVMAAKL